MSENETRYKVQCKKCGLETDPLPSEVVAHDRLEDCEEVPCQGSVVAVEEGE